MSWAQENKVVFFIIFYVLTYHSSNGHIFTDEETLGRSSILQETSVVRNCNKQKEIMKGDDNVWNYVFIDFFFFLILEVTFAILRLVLIVLPRIL